MSYFTKQPVQRVALPSNSELWVDVYTKFNWRQEKAVGMAVAAGGMYADAVLQSAIADWNLTDDNGIAPVDREHIDMLAREDAIAIYKVIEGLTVTDESKDAKKSSSNESLER